MDVEPINQNKVSSILECRIGSLIIIIILKLELTCTYTTR